MNAGDVQVFSRVAKTGNFSEAAEQLGLTRSTVSKSISRLEERLGVVLIHRSTRSSSLTDAGRRFYEHAREVDAALDKAVAAVSGDDQEVVGNLSISLPTSLGAALTPALVGQFRRKWPRLSLSLEFNDEYVDLIGGSIDVAIRIAKRLSDSNLLSRRLSETKGILVASPGYLSRYGTPKSVEELEKHRCLDIGRADRMRVVWRFDGADGPIEVPVQCTMNANSDLPLILAACMDEGILYTPAIAVSNELAQGRLTEILSESTKSQSFGIYAVYPNHGRPAKVRAFIDFIADQLPLMDATDRWFWSTCSESRKQNPD